jgi:hypothetical protein
MPGGAGGSSHTFLTAAEQRAQSSKNEKKDKEDAFEFLIDIQDVSRDVRFLYDQRSDTSLPERWKAAR